MGPLGKAYLVYDGLLVKKLTALIAPLNTQRPRNSLDPFTRRVLYDVDSRRQHSLHMGGDNEESAVKVFKP